MPDELHIDLETFSTIDLPKSGAYRYSERSEIMMASYALNDEPTRLWDITQGPVPVELLEMIEDPAVIKWAHNAPFERTNIRRAWGIECPPEAWRCTAVMAASLGLPRSLGELSAALRLPQDKAKMGIGRSLISYFCKPCKPTKKNGGRVRNLPEHDLEKWELFGQYCVRDTDAERTVHKLLGKFPLREEDWQLWFLDQEINDRGLLVDRAFVDAAIAMDDIVRERLLREAMEITKLGNPNSAKQLKAWLLSEEDLEAEDLKKKTVLTLLGGDVSGTARRVLEIRQQLAKTSVTKYQALRRYMSEHDDRIRGVLLYRGAGRTGRWSGQGFQPQNLARPTIEEPEDLKVARALVKAGDLESVELLYGNPSQTLSDLIRTAIVAPQDRAMVVADLSAIEARVLAWGAGEEWRMEVFNTHGKIYEASASEMFKVPLALIKKGNAEYGLRQKGKISELALGYQGGSGALITMGALDMGLVEEELPELVRLWREANPAIVRFWYQMDADAKEVIGQRRVIHRPQYSMACHGGFFIIKLPSGRRLHYYSPALIRDEKGREQITYMGVNQYTRKWERLKSYGGKLVENWTQAVACDVLAEGLLAARRDGHCLAGHVHDEIIAEGDHGDVAALEDCMSRPLAWAPGLPLKAAGFSDTIYRKD